MDSSQPMEKEKHIFGRHHEDSKPLNIFWKKEKERERASGFLIKANILRRLAIFCQVLLPYAKGFCFILFSFLKLSQLTALYLTHLGHFLVPLCDTGKPVSPGLREEQNKMNVLVAQSYPSLCDPMTAVHQASLSMEFSRQENWSGSHFLFQGNFLTQGSNPGLLHHRQVLYHLSHKHLYLKA